MQRMCVRAFVLVNCWVWALPFAAAQGTKSCDAVPVDKTVCSYTGLNRNCTITIDRMNPITPPTVYAKPDAKNGAEPNEMPNPAPATTFHPGNTT